MATAKKATKKRTKKLSPNTKPAPPGQVKFSCNLPEKVVKAFKKRAKKIKDAGEQNGDGRWGFQSLIRETLEKAALKF